MLPITIRVGDNVGDNVGNADNANADADNANADNANPVGNNPLHNAAMAYLLANEFDEYQHQLQELQEQMQQRIRERRVRDIEKQRLNYYLALSGFIPSFPCVIISFLIWIIVKFPINVYMMLGYGFCVMTAIITGPVVSPACGSGVPTVEEYRQAYHDAYGTDPPTWRKRHCGF